MRWTGADGGPEEERADVITRAGQRTNAKQVESYTDINLLWFLLENGSRERDHLRDDTTAAEHYINRESPL